MQFCRNTIVPAESYGNLEDLFVDDCPKSPPAVPAKNEGNHYPAAKNQHQSQIETNQAPDGMDNMKFFCTLIPHVNQVNLDKILKLRNEIHDLVTEFAYDESTEEEDDDEGKDLDQSSKIKLI